MRDLSSEIAEKRKRLHQFIEELTPSDVEHSRVVTYAAQIGGGAGAAEQSSRPSHEPLSLDNIDDVMKYQPWDREQLAAGDVVREALTAAAKAILRAVPSCRARDKALEQIVGARMDANAALSFRGRF